MSRLLDFYLATAAQVYAMERPGDRVADHLHPTDYPGLGFESRHQAQDWLYAEAVSLLACVRQFTGASTLPRAIDLLWAAVDLTESGANSREYDAAAIALRDAARTCGDQRAQVRAAVVLANAHQLSGRFTEADESAEDSLRLGDSHSDPPARCWAANIRGAIAFYQRRYADAEKHFKQALADFRDCADRAGEASVLCNLSRIHLVTGRPHSAVELAEQGVDMYETLGHAVKSANGRYALGMALTENGRHVEATERLQEALDVFRESRQRLWEGMTLFRLAELDLAAGRPTQASANAEAALTVLRGIGGEWRRGNVLTLLGRALDDIGQSGRARVCWQEALSIYQSLHSPEAETVRALMAQTAAA
jgi:tetratricopeptide (TPR) repeat protein